MKKVMSIILFSMVIFTGCYNNEDNYVPDIRVHVFYETIDKPGIKRPDIGAKVFYYYKICIEDSAGYTYKGEGLFMKNNFPMIKPDEEYTIGENGSIFFIPKYMDESASIAIESKYYEKEIAFTYFSSTKNGAGFYKIFKPTK
ncbi:hypothetical protein [Dysgonomonas sp.]